MPPLSAKALGQEWVRVTSVKGKSRRLQLALEGWGGFERASEDAHRTPSSANCRIEASEFPS